MKYQPPLGAPGIDDPYVDGDPSIAREGSIVPAGSIEFPQREIVNFITDSNFVGSDGDLHQLTRATRSGYVNYATDTGVLNALSVTLNPPLEGYRAGIFLRVKSAYTNTSGTVTINVNGLGPRPIKRTGGSNLVAGDILVGGICNLVDDGTVFQLVNFLGAIGGTINNFATDIPYAEDTSVTPNSIIVSFTPAITNPQPGDVVLVKVNNVNTSAVTMTVNALAAKAVNRCDGLALEARDHFLNEVILLEYHTTYWQMMRLVRSQVFFKLTADLILYVRTDGNDLNDGSINDAAHAFLHIQAAIDFVSRSFLIAGRTVTIQLGNPGTYTGQVVFQNIPGQIVLRGDPNGRTNYIVSNTGSGVCYVLGSGISVTVDGLTFYQGSANINSCTVGNGANVTFRNVRFSGVAGVTGNDVYTNNNGSVTMSGNIDFFRNVNACMTYWTGSNLTIGEWTTVITMNSITFTQAFIFCTTNSSAEINQGYCSFSGSAFGPRYLAILNSVVNTRGGAATYLPGNAAGSVDASSVYA
jgi:hypothetical protein